MNTLRESVVGEKCTLLRKRVLKAGSISLGVSAISCTVRNLTRSGAMLEVASRLGVPRQFTLVISSDDIHRECQIVWV